MDSNASDGKCAPPSGFEFPDLKDAPSIEDLYKKYGYHFRDGALDTMVQQQQKTRQLRDLVDAMETSAGDSMRYGFPNKAEPATIYEQIRWRIEYHQKMIKTLEWFGAHLGLDKPEEELLVREVIIAGLEAISKRARE